MKQTAISFLFVPLALATFTGCVSTGSKQAQVKLTSPSLQRPVVAVLPFAAPNYKSLPLEDRGVRDFERSYLPAHLVLSLRRTPGIGEAYFSPGATAAADLIVHGSITKSDGKMTSVNITVNAADGSKLWSSGFSVNTSSADYVKSPNPSGRLWPQIAAAIVKTKQKPGQFVVSRTVGYSGQKDYIVTDKRAFIAGEGAKSEREGMLQPTTNKLVSKAVLADPLYLTWQRESTPLVEQRSQEKSKSVMNGISMVLGGVAAAGGAYTGNTAAQAQGEQTMMTSANSIDVSNAKIEEINQTLAATSQGLVSHQGQPVSVRLFGKVYTFSGSLENQQSELRKLIASKMAEVGN